jgi:outer membrane lipoprotein SlyB
MAMKKFITTFMMFAMMAVMVPLFSNSASAQTRTYYRNGRVYTTTYNRPSFYKRHRNVINMAIGTGAGALLGGLIGGRRGALIGTLAGAGGSALYTYKIRPKTPVYYYR